MSILIRPAQLEDAPQIGLIKQRVWPDEAVSETRISHILQQADHITRVAVTTEGAVAGFVDSFPTRSREDVLRWEVDLLAVHPDHQGQKIGQQLIQAATEAGWPFGAAWARALVQVENFPCQGAMRRCGYTSDGQVYWLMISTQQRAAGGSLDGAGLIPVDTMNYAGLWLEGARTPAALEAAQIERTRRGGDLVGALIRADETGLLEAAEMLGYQWVSDFHWWVQRGPSPAS